MKIPKIVLEIVVQVKTYTVFTLNESVSPSHRHAKGIKMCNILNTVNMKFFK